MRGLLLCNRQRAGADGGEQRLWMPNSGNWREFGNQIVKKRTNERENWARVSEKNLNLMTRAEHVICHIYTSLSKRKDLISLINVTEDL